MLGFLRQKEHFPLILVVLAMVMVSGMWFLSVRTPAYAVIIDGQQKFMVKDRRNVDKAIQEISREQNNGLDKKEAELAKAVTIRRTMAARRDIIKPEEVLNTLRKEVKFDAVAIVVNGKAVTYVASKDVANDVLTKLKKQYSQVDQGEKLISANLQEKVTLKNQKVAPDKVKKAEQALVLLTTGNENPQKYEVKEGDSLWIIARRNDMYVDDIKKANHLEGEDLQLGQELVLLKSQPYINVISKVEGQKVEVIPFETKVVTDRNVASSIKVKQEGQTGEKQIAYVATKCNGVVSQKNVLEEKIVKAAVDKIIVKGSRVTYVASRGGGGSGNLDWPVHGSISNILVEGIPDLI